MPWRAHAARSDPLRTRHRAVLWLYFLGITIVWGSGIAGARRWTVAAGMTRGGTLL